MCLHYFTCNTWTTMKILLAATTERCEICYLTRKMWMREVAVISKINLLLDMPVKSQYSWAMSVRRRRRSIKHFKKELHGCIPSHYWWQGLHTVPYFKYGVWMYKPSSLPAMLSCFFPSVIASLRVSAAALLLVVFPGWFFTAMCFGKCSTVETWEVWSATYVYYNMPLNQVWFW